MKLRQWSEVCLPCKITNSISLHLEEQVAQPCKPYCHRPQVMLDPEAAAKQRMQRSARKARGRKRKLEEEKRQNSAKTQFRGGKKFGVKRGGGGGGGGGGGKRSRH